MNQRSYPLLKRLLRGYVLPFKGRLLAAMVAMLFVAAFTAFFAHLIQPLFDEGFIARNMGALGGIVALMLLLNLVKGIAHYYQQYLMEFIGLRAVANLQRDLYERIVRQDLTFFQRHSTDSLTSRFVFDIQRLKQTITQLFAAGLRDTAIIIGLLANLFIKDWLLAIIALVVIPLSIIPIRQFGRLMRKYSRVSQEQTGDLNNQLGESFRLTRQVKTDTLEQRELERASGHIEDVFLTTLRAARVRALSSPVLEVIGTIAISLVILVGGWRAASGDLTAGGFASFLTSLLLVFRPLKGLTNMNNVMQEGLAAAERTFDLLDEDVDVKEHVNATELKITKGELVFKDIQFSYPDGTVALDGVNLTIQPGQTVALVGASGAGKSTILNLVPRFFDPTSGSVSVDGQNIAESTLGSLRAQVGLLSQDLAIFNTSAEENIKLSKPNATEKELKAAIKAAAAEFVYDLPQGLQTVLGEAGVKISGGQKQRLAMARAFLKNAPILLLDEPTSQLDSQSEQQILQELNTLMKGRTTLIVAHRLSTITGVDTIHVLDKGQIVESGTHAELLKQNGAYAQLWALQANA